MKFKINIKEILQVTVEIEASTKEAALAKVKEMYEDEKIVLTADDHTDTEMIIT